MRKVQSRGMYYNEAMDKGLKEIINQHPVFSSLEAQERALVLERGRLIRYEAGSILTHAGDRWPYLFLVMAGCVNATKESSEGRGLVVAEFGEEELFWGLAFFLEDTENPVTLQFTQDSQLCLWAREDMLPILMKNGRMSWEISQIMVRRMLRASEVIEGLAFQPVAGRLARLLMEYPGRAHSGPTTRSLTLDEMAARIGSTREMVCRFLQKFADDGWIRITRTEFEVIDGGKLGEMAQKVKP